MLDDLIGQIVGEAAFGRLGRSRRAQLLFRLFFGFLGAVLGLIGAVHFVRNPPAITNGPMFASIITLFLSLACFSLFNIGMARGWRWPGLCFLLSLASMFVTRIAFGP